jgi:hypothetical protein
MWDTQTTSSITFLSDNSSENVEQTSFQSFDQVIPAYLQKIAYQIRRESRICMTGPDAVIAFLK